MRFARALLTSKKLLAGKNNLEVCFSRRDFSQTLKVSHDTMEHELTFHKVADRALEELYDGLGTVEAKLDDCDITLSQGVLNVSLGDEYPGKSWVINKQTPNRQIWWSSPLSGPRRYEFEGLVSQMDTTLPASTYWRCTKDRKEDLWNKMKEEISSITGVAMTRSQSNKTK
jgi:frataxin